MYLQGFFRNESYTLRESSGMTHTFKQSNMSNSINCEFNWMNYKNQVRISVYIILEINIDTNRFAILPCISDSCSCKEYCDVGSDQDKLQFEHVVSHKCH